MNTLIANYQNGNLNDARRAAARHTFPALLVALQAAGYGPKATIAIAAYLKDQGTFQAACDAENDEKGQGEKQVH